MIQKLLSIIQKRKILSGSLLLLPLSLLMSFIISFSSQASDNGVYDYLTNNIWLKELYTQAYNSCDNPNPDFAPNIVFAPLNATSQYQYFFCYRYNSTDFSEANLYVYREDVSSGARLGLNQYDRLIISEETNNFFIRFNTNENLDFISFVRCGTSSSSPDINFISFEDVIYYHNLNWIYFGFNSAYGFYKDPDLLLSPTTFAESGHSIGTVPELPEFDDFGHLTEDDPIPDNKSIFNIIGSVGKTILSGFKWLRDSFVEFLKPYLDFISGVIQDIKDYLTEEPDFTEVGHAIENSSVGNLIFTAQNASNLLEDAIKNADNHVTAPHFSWTFPLLEREFTISYDFSWYTSEVKGVFLAFFVPFWLLGCIVYFIKSIPDLLSGISGLKGGQ